jgi:hypothetical protein
MLAAASGTPVDVETPTPFAFCLGSPAAAEPAGEIRDIRLGENQSMAKNKKEIASCIAVIAASTRRYRVAKTGRKNAVTSQSAAADDRVRAANSQVD